jgi:lysophospholipase L1-like esterase
MKTIFLFFLCITTLWGCAQNPGKMQTAQTTSTKEKYTYLALGDSYTIGESVSQQASFPYQLKAQLTALKYQVSDPDIIAVTGWTTGDLKDAIAQAIVTLLIGVNNQYRGYSQTEYRAEFVQLLHTAINFAGGNKNKVFILSIPDYSVTPFANGSNTTKIATEIDRYNAINKEESVKAGVNYTDITDISRQAKTDPSLIAFDGLHPSEKMYELWMKRLAPKVAAILK